MLLTGAPGRPRGPGSPSSPRAPCKIETPQEAKQILKGMEHLQLSLVLEGDASAIPFSACDLGIFIINTNILANCFLTFFKLYAALLEVTLNVSKFCIQNSGNYMYGINNCILHQWCPTLSPCGPNRQCQAQPQAGSSYWGGYVAWP